MEESKKAGSHPESKPRHLACAASILPLRYNNLTSSHHNSLYARHRWGRKGAVAHTAATQHVTQNI